MKSGLNGVWTRSSSIRKGKILAQRSRRKVDSTFVMLRMHSLLRSAPTVRRSVSGRCRVSAVPGVCGVPKWCGASQRLLLCPVSALTHCSCHRVFAPSFRLPVRCVSPLLAVAAPALCCCSPHHCHLECLCVCVCVSMSVSVCLCVRLCVHRKL